MIIESSGRKEHMRLHHSSVHDAGGFITVECLLTFNTDEDKKNVIGIVRKFSSMVRFAYKRMLEKTGQKDLRKFLPIRYGINARYSNSAILLAEQALASCLERKQNPKKVANKASPSHIGQGTTPQNNLKSDLYLPCVAN